MTDLQDVVQGAQPSLSHSEGLRTPELLVPQGCVSQESHSGAGGLELLIFRLRWNPKELSSNTSDAAATGEMNSAARMRASRQRTLFFFGVLSPGRPPAGKTQV